jgi:hypothetical protein
VDFVFPQGDPETAVHECLTRLHRLRLEGRKAELEARQRQTTDAALRTAVTRELQAVLIELARKGQVRGGRT